MGTVSIIFREDKIDKKGLAPVAIKIYDSLTRKRKQQFTGIRISPKHWDAENLRVAKSHPNSTRFNNVIASKFNVAYQTLLKVEEEANEENPFEFEEGQADGGNFNFFEYGGKVLTELRKDKSAYARAEKVQGALKNLQKYLEHLKRQEEEAKSEKGKKPRKKWLKREGIQFSDFTYAFIDGYDKFLRLELGRKPASMKSSLTGIRAVFNHAIQHKKVDQKWLGFTGFRLTGQSSKIVFLNDRQQRELAMMEFEVGSKKDLARDMYLFCAWGGGFRWADVAQMKWSKIEGREIYFKTGKSETDVAFTIPDKALKILDKYRREDAKPGDYIFPMLNSESMQKPTKQQRYHVKGKNSQTNKVLKEIQQSLDLEWKLTFHSSRHTFATMAIRNGMPVEVLRVILGHSDISITMQYVHITGEKVREEMAKLNARMNAAQTPVEAQQVKPSPMADFVRRFIESTASEMGVEIAQVDGLALEMYEAIQQLPKESQQTIPIRIEAKGDHSTFEQTLAARSLFGEAIRFVVRAA